MQPKWRNCLACLLLSLCSFGAGAPQAYNYYNNYKNYNNNNAYRRAAAYSGYSANSYNPNAQRLSSTSSTSVRPQNSYTANYYSPTSYNPHPNYANSPYSAARAALQTQRHAPRNAYTTKPPVNSARDKNRVSKADSENAKFAGSGNLEAAEESTKTFAHLRRKFRRNRCYGFGRSAAADATRTTPAPKEQGRFLWDVNVYNVYNGGRPGLYSDVQQSPLSSSYGCGGGLLGGGGGLLGGGGGLFDGGLGGGLGGGLLSDPIAAPYPVPPLNNFLSLFAPGILQNALAVTARPRPLPPPVQADTTGSEVNDLQSDPAVDPAYGQLPAIPLRPVPNRIFYDTPGAAPITPAQLVGGVATTVNGLIQQLTGNVQPVYPSVG